MKTRTELLLTINHKNWLRLLTLALGLITLLPLQRLTAETPTTRGVEKQELRNSNGDLLADADLNAPATSGNKWTWADLFRARLGMDPFSKDMEEAALAARMMNSTTGISPQ